MHIKIYYPFHLKKYSTFFAEAIRCSCASSSNAFFVDLPVSSQNPGTTNEYRVFKEHATSLTSKTLESRCTASRNERSKRVWSRHQALRLDQPHEAKRQGALD
ncbi:hypothetical protein T10_6830 [Trichinella papuae]|uniref:Uncharacterized protein n=1 Tax=Trichinella papuae TaxID=268474 RepID=A0A0V1MD27_9BILA|nr:hypothetical protein T10_6830 [Trichinella papuae]